MNKIIVIASIAAVGVFTFLLGRSDGASDRINAQFELASLRLEKAQAGISTLEGFLKTVVEQRNVYSNKLVEVSIGYGAERGAVLEYAFGHIPPALAQAVAAAAAARPAPVVSNAPPPIEKPAGTNSAKKKP